MSIIKSIITDEKRQGAEDFKHEVERCLNQKEFQQVVHLYTNALKLDSNNADYYAARANAFFQLKDFQSALRDANTCIECNKDEVKGYSSRATTYMSLNQYELALQDYKKIHQLEPSHKNEEKIKTVERIIQGKL